MDFGQLQEYSLASSANAKHYEWQLLVLNQWLRIENDQVIETHYCQPGAKGITINTNQGKIYIDFDQLQTLNAAVKVKRLSFLPPGQTEEIAWYFRDDQLWREYGAQSSSPTSSISSADIERQFTVNPQGVVTFIVGSMSYNLNFSNMTQTNSITGMCRKVRRRPKFTSTTTQTSLVNPNSSSLNVMNGGIKWEFMGNTGAWMEYQAYICGFDSNDIERQYQLNPQGQIPFRINTYSYSLDFSNMCQVNNNIGTKRAVRRTANDESQPNTSLGPQPRWQFVDIEGLWRDYVKGQRRCSVSSQDIELQYQQNPTGTFMFTAGRYTYDLDFAAMTQTNRSTNTVRSVQRLNQ